jgi:uncharacterized protein with HEPN domain
MKPTRADADLAHLWDMLQAARTVSMLCEGVSAEGLLADLRTRLALERALEILGEAARRVSARRRAAHPEIPWRGIIGFRNVLAHEYGEIDYRRLYTVATDGVPPLIVALERQLAESPPAAGAPAKRPRKR